MSTQIDDNAMKNNNNNNNYNNNNSKNQTNAANTNKKDTMHHEDDDDEDDDDDATQQATSTSEPPVPTTVTVRTRRPKTKHKRPEGMPRRPLSAYNFFYKAERVRWLEEQKGRKAPRRTDEPKKSDFLEMGKAISQRWRKLSADARIPYEKDAKEDLERYRREMDAYNMSLVRTYSKHNKSNHHHHHHYSGGGASSPYAKENNSDSSGGESKLTSSSSQSKSGVEKLKGLLEFLPMLQSCADMQQQKISHQQPQPPTAAPPLAHTHMTAILQQLLRLLLDGKLNREGMREARSLLNELEQILRLMIHYRQREQQQREQKSQLIANQQVASSLLDLILQLQQTNPT